MDEILKQQRKIHEVIEKTMKKDIHYGQIPGTDGLTMYKRGAQILLRTFRLKAEYEIIHAVREKDYISYTSKCTLVHAPSGIAVSTGLGSCNTQEEKYRYRYEEIFNGEPVPAGYWKAKKANNSKEMKRLAKGRRVRKNEDTGQWELCDAKKVENDNPRALDNTILKMANKRALKDATENALAVSDIFMEFAEEEPMDVTPPPTEEPPEENAARERAKQGKTDQKDMFGGK